MNNLININAEGRITARELYEFLELNPAHFARWAKINIADNKFALENTDFVRITLQGVMPTGGKIERYDYELSIDFAKKLCMISKSTKGEQARDYFIAVEKQYNAKVAPTALPQVEVDLIATKYASEILRPSEAGKIKMLTKVCKNHNINTNFLPSYTEEDVTRSATELLAKHGKPMSVVAFNKRLIALGLLEVKTRNSKGNTKKEFKSLTEIGLSYGKNLVSPMNERETQPHFYEAKFPELLGKIGA